MKSFDAAPYSYCIFIVSHAPAIRQPPTVNRQPPTVFKKFQIFTQYVLCITHYSPSSISQKILISLSLLSLC